MKYTERSRADLLREQEECRAKYEELKARGLKLDMSRGKPGKEQLDLVSDILTVLADPADCVVDGTDVRNYGAFSGLPGCPSGGCCASWRRAPPPPRPAPWPSG